MLPLLPLLVLLLSFLAGSAQTIVSGKVKDGKGHPVQGASITIKDTYDGATTDSLGAFQFKTTEKGEQTMLVTSIGLVIVLLSWFFLPQQLNNSLMLICVLLLFRSVRKYLAF